jgi:hypothetical protein
MSSTTAATAETILEVGRALLKTRAYNEIQAMIRVETLRAMEIPGQVINSPVHLASLLLIKDWLHRCGLTQTLTALNMEITDNTTSSTTTARLEDFVPQSFATSSSSTSVLTLSKIMGHDHSTSSSSPAVLSTQGQVVIVALHKRNALVGIHAKLRNLVLNEFRSPGSSSLLCGNRFDPASPEQAACGVVVQTWLSKHGCLHSKDVLLLETGLLDDGRGSLPAFNLDDALGR